MRMPRLFVHVSFRMRRVARPAACFRRSARARASEVDTAGAQILFSGECNRNTRGRLFRQQDLDLIEAIAFSDVSAACRRISQQPSPGFPGSAGPASSVKQSSLLLQVRLTKLPRSRLVQKCGEACPSTGTRIARL